MRGFYFLCAVVALSFAATLGLDLFQRKLTYPGRTPILYASMWAPGEPMQKAYAQLFAEFEREHPNLKVEARWDGRHVLPAIRPRLLTRTDVPDLVNVEGEAWRVLTREGCTVALDEALNTEPHPGDAGKRLRDAILPALLARGFLEEERGALGASSKYRSGTYMLPAGVHTTCIFYNRLHYEKLGLRAPRLWSEFLENCRQLQAAGIPPLAADQDAYADMWPAFLFNRSVGEDGLERTILGTGTRFDEDPRYRAVLQAIRDLHRPGFHMPGWEGSIWPAAQRRWTNGEATHLICGSWIVRETLEYEPDPEIFRMGAFPVPALDTVEWGGRPPLPLGDPTGADAGLTGHVLLRDGRNREGALKLLSFLCRRKSAEVLARVGKDIPPVAGAPFPIELEEVRPAFQSAGTIYRKGVTTYAPKWQKFVWKELFHDFFMFADPAHAKYLSVDEFLRRLQEQTGVYRKNQGEAGIR